MTAQSRLPSAIQTRKKKTNNWFFTTGLISGLTISLFSKPLALLLGLAFLGLHTAEKQLGISIIPYNTVQKYVKGVDLRSAVQDNAALKVSFGVMFALSGFASF